MAVVFHISSHWVFLPHSYFFGCIFQISLHVFSLFAAFTCYNKMCKLQFTDEKENVT